MNSFQLTSENEFETRSFGKKLSKQILEKCFASTSITVNARHHHAINRIGVPSVSMSGSMHGITNTGLHCKMCLYERSDGSSVAGQIPCWWCTTTMDHDLTIMTTDMQRSSTEKLNIRATVKSLPLSESCVEPLTITRIRKKEYEDYNSYISSMTIIIQPFLLTDIWNCTVL